MRPILPGKNLNLLYRMRTFGLSLAVVSVAAMIAAPSPLSAQRNVRRSTSQRQASAEKINTVSPSSSASSASPAGNVAAHCSADCDDYSLAVVSALLPSQTTGSSDVVTLVIENRGGMTAPASIISVAPRNHLTLARQSALPVLAPGQRATIQLPVEIGPDGTPCISITIVPAPAAYPATARFLASAAPNPPAKMPSDTGVKSWDSFARFDGLGRVGYFGEPGAW